MNISSEFDRLNHAVPFASLYIGKFDVEFDQGFDVIIVWHSGHILRKGMNLPADRAFDFRMLFDFLFT